MVWLSKLPKIQERSQMNMKLGSIVLVTALSAACAVCAFAGDIVTVPTANQLKAGEYDIAGYYIGLDTPPGGPDYVLAGTLYYGITDDLEIDLHGYQVDKPIDKSSIVAIASYRLLPETANQPIIVAGVRNIFGTSTGYDGNGNKTKKRSYYLSAAKTVNAKPGGPPKWPIVRLHLSVGTADNTILGANRHEGVFGGVQLRLSPQVGLAAMHDSRDLITAITFDPIKELTVKGGTFGTHWWVGISYAKSLK